MKKIINSNYFYAFISLCCAVWLFFMVSTPGVGSTRDSNQSSTTTASIKANLTAPLQIQADTNDYYITGYPENVKVEIEGPAALVTATKNTQNFKAYLNLKGLSVGEHRVQVKINGLNNELTSSVKPKYVTVNIQKRKTKTFSIDAEYNKASLEDGYEIGKVSITPNTVTVTGAAPEVKRIAKVVVQATLPKGIKTTFDQEVLVQALDKNGKTVNVTLDPQTVHVKIPISIPSKEVTLNFKQKNSDSDSSSSYSFDSDTKTIRVYGSQDQLDDIGDSISVPVDVSDVTSNTKKTVKLSDALGSQVISTDPDSVDVNIGVKSSSSTSSSNSSNSSSTNTTSNGSSNSNTNSSTNSTNNNSDEN